MCILNLCCLHVFSQLHPSPSPPSTALNVLNWHLLPCAATSFRCCAPVQVLGWVFFTVAVQAVPAGLFTIIGAAQMAQWAVQKHKRLQKVGSTERIVVGGGHCGHIGGCKWLPMQEHTFLSLLGVARLQLLSPSSVSDACYLLPR